MSPDPATVVAIVRRIDLLNGESGEVETEAVLVSLVKIDRLSRKKSLNYL